MTTDSRRLSILTTGEIDEFNPAVSKIDIDALVARYADPAYWNMALKEENAEPLG